MTITTTLKRFDKLSEILLRDDKIDETEAEVLLAFIEDYAKAGNKAFVELRKALLKAKLDGVITADESKDLVSKIDEAKVFLKHEQKIETVLAWIAGIALLAGIVYYVSRMTWPLL